MTTISLHLMILWVNNLSGAQLGGFFALCDVDGRHSVLINWRTGWSENPSQHLLSVTSNLAGVKGMLSSSGIGDRMPAHGLSSGQSQGSQISCMVAQSFQR